MIKSKTSKLLLILVLVLAITVGVALAISIRDFLPAADIGAGNADGKAAAATITAATSFDKAPNGMKYYYTTSSTSVTKASYTIISTYVHGTSPYNPFVINTAAQCQLFVQRVNEGDTN